MMSIETAPFNALAEVMRGLRDRFVGELPRADRPTQPPSPWCGEFVGSLAALVTQLDNLNKRLDGLRRHDPPAYEAFLRAMENS